MQLKILQCLHVKRRKEDAHEKIQVLFFLFGHYINLAEEVNSHGSQLLIFILKK